MQASMIYGANGYTGRLIAAEAARRGHKPVLAGRNRDALDELAAQLKLTRRWKTQSCPSQKTCKRSE